MVPPRPAARKPAAREADYSNIGVAGRKTGVVLKDTGVRDEHGMEPIDGIFSSPDDGARSGGRRPRRSNATITDESDMRTGSSIPDPAEMLARGRRSLPPAKARSPIKTHLQSPAKRSVGGASPFRRPLLSSPLSQELANGSPPARESPWAQRRNLLSTQRGKGKGKASGEEVYNFPVSDDEDEQVEEEEEEEEEEEVEEVEEADSDDYDADPAGLQLADEMQYDDVPLPQEVDEDEEMEEEEELPPPKPVRNQQPQKRGGKAAQAREVEEDPPAKPAPKRRGRPPKNAAAPAPPRKRANQATDDGPDRPEPQPKRRKQAAATPPKARTQLPAAANADASPRTRPPPKNDANQGRPRSRGLLVLRSETPAADGGATVMRSGRTSVKPMAYWRNERLVFGEGRVEGKHLSLPGIKEVIRTEEVEPPKAKKRGGGGRRAKGRGRARSAEAEDDADDDAEPWETEVGVLSADVRAWDPEAGDGSDEHLEEIELAYAPKGLDLAAREVKDGKFLYGKTVTLPFFHSGIVDLPPGGEKRMRNSRKHHMAFCVVAGRVDVELNEFAFSIGRGGMWQVPRGNWYGLKNPYDRPTRVFFSQGCYMQEEEDAQAE